MPYRKRRRWKRFVQKTNAVAEKTLGSRTVVRNEARTHAVGGVAANTSNVVGVHALYSNTHPSVPALNDLRQISSDTSVGGTGKFLFQSGIMDLTITNTSSTDGITSYNLPIEMDVYEISAGRNFSNTSGGKSLLDVFTDASSDTPTITFASGAPSSLELSDRGTTPWDLPNALSAFKIKIWKKTKYKLSGGQSISYQMRDPRRHVFEKSYLQDLDGSNFPRATKWIMIIAKPIVGYGVQETGFCSVAVGDTRKYLYKIQEKTDEVDAVV